MRGEKGGVCCLSGFWLIQCFMAVLLSGCPQQLEYAPQWEVLGGAIQFQTWALSGRRGPAIARQSSHQKNVLQDIY